MHLHITARPEAKPNKESVDFLAILYQNDIWMDVYESVDDSALYFSRTSSWVLLSLASTR